jgi:hypothetical protein
MTSLTESVGEPGSATRPTFTRALAAIARVVAPTVLLTSVLYYFGWARTEAAADRAGTDQSLFGYSTRDYVLRSVGPLYRPIGVGLLVATVLIIVAGAARQLLSVRVARGAISQRWVAVMMFGLLGIGVGAAAIGAVGLERVQTQEPAHLSAMLMLLSAVALWGALALADMGTGDLSHALGRQRALVLGVILALFLVGTFAIVLRLAFEDGAGSINSFIEGLEHEPEVVITSDRPLDIELPGVQPEVIHASEETGTASRFRYRGLHFLVEANGRLFLVTKGFGRPDASSAVAVIPRTGDLRLDFIYAGDGGS